MVADETRTQTTLVDGDASTKAAGDGGQTGADAGLLRQGDKVGRYLVLSELGVGGMGVVYEAYDPQLDRRIALKLLRVRTRRSLSDVRAKERLLREAQAIAQLSHVNVVTAYDVGTFGDNVFVAMELVKGTTLKQWVAGGSRPVRAILEVLIAAGRGIAAAHAAGLVHRDVKPSNILVGDDGRVRVVDFGLARVSAATESSDDALTPDTVELLKETPDTVASLLESGDHWLTSPVTVVGALVGTPGYVAPEQYDGAEIGERSDQFGFCATMFYALYGTRAFVGRSPRELQRAVQEGKIQPAPKDSAVPARIRRIILRGLASDPAERYASMDDLLADLSRDPYANMRRVGLGGAVLATVATLAWVGMRGSADGRACTIRPEVTAGAWDERVRQSVARRFRSTQNPRAAALATAASRAIDRRISAWKKMRVEACQATHVHKTQSQKLMDLRMQCLDRRLGELAALTHLFATEADASVVDNAPQSVYSLRSLTRCADAQALTAVIPPPENRDAQRKVNTLFAQLDKARAHLAAGKYKEGLVIARAAVAEARALDYPPALAQALHVRGYLEGKASAVDEARDTLQLAAVVSARARDDRLLAKVSLDMAYVVGNLKRQYPEALAAMRLTEAAVERAGAPPELRADWLTNLGFLLDRTGDTAGARRALTEALALWESALGKTHPSVAHTLNQLAIVAGTSGDPVSAGAYLRRALSIWESTLGSDHPKLGVGYNNLGQAEFDQGNFTSALAHFERARELYTARLGPGHPKVAIAALNISGVLAKQGNCEVASKTVRKALSVFESSLGKSHPYVAYALVQLAECDLSAGRGSRAIPLLRRARHIRESLPKAKAELGRVCFLLAQALWQLPASRAAAKQSALDARTAYLAAGPHATKQLTEVDQWLASRNAR